MKTVRPKPLDRVGQPHLNTAADLDRRIDVAGRFVDTDLRQDDPADTKLPDPRAPTGLQATVIQAMAGPQLPPLGELDVMLTGIRAMLEAPDSPVPERLAQTARMVLDDELHRVAIAVERTAGLA
ncbi:MAG: hypothetical protein AAFR17_09115 [Pseudomonadota bacterium]